MKQTTYPLHCILPSDRVLVFQSDTQVLSECHEEVEPSKYLVAYMEEDTIKYHEINEVEKKLSFIYTPYLTFLHETDLRNLVYDSFDELSECETEILPPSDSFDHVLTNSLRQLQHEILGIKFISESIGHGIVALKEIENDSIIGEYTGIVSKHSKETNSSYSCYYPSSDGGYGINAIEYGNLIRFINHNQEQPNVKFQAYRIDGIYHILVVRKNLLK